MIYKLKVSFRTNGRIYAPGEILPADISAGDLAFLKRKGFVEPVDVELAADYAGNETGDSQDPGGDETGIHFPGLGEFGEAALKSPEEIYKMRSKDEVYIYAQSIGLDLGDEYKGKSLKELQEAVVNFQEEMESGVEEE